MVLLIVIVLGIGVAMSWGWYTESKWYQFYDPNKCLAIIEKYSGSRSMQILRALSNGELKPNDIKHYFNYGTRNRLSLCRQEYLLINQFKERNECEIVCKHSGYHRSTLDRVSLDICNGKAIVTENWTAW